MACACVLMLSAKAKDYVITNYGIVNDSTIVQTKSIQAVIDKAGAAGGGTIVIPKGTYMSGALFFKPGTHLRLNEGAVLKGSDNIVDYPLIPSRMEGKKLDYFAALVNAYQVEKFSISGPGEINGNGLKFWKAFWHRRDSLKQVGKSATNLEVHRPRLIFIWGSNNTKISGVKLRNSGFWTTHIYQSNDILIENCDIRSPFKPVPAPSTDGIDLDVCKNVIIRNCYISVNDDAVCIKGGKGPTAQSLPENGIVENVLVENCTFGDAHAVLTLGSECIHGKNIVLRNCKINNHRPLLNLKMRPDTFQLYEDILIENISGQVGTLINMRSWTQFFNMEGVEIKPFGTVRNITMRNINVTADKVGDIVGNSTDKVSNIKLENIRVTAKNAVLNTNHQTNVSAKNVIVNGAPLVMADDSALKKSEDWQKPAGR